MNDVSGNSNTMESSDEALSRRGFVKLAVGAVGACYAAAIGYPVYRYLTSPAEMEAAEAAVSEVTLKDAEHLPAGTALMFKFGAHPAVLIHHKDGKWVALTAVCTHLGCTVQYHPEADLIKCACHGGVYNAYTGKNIDGPPPRPLTAYKVTVDKGDVKVSRV
ncbi:cytochrome b6-f complex iron-sulfur subunit [mine drainage metagenome]|uniref:Cytochrome b6-f complex iron-sulfur subunit n=1 Tax=mine drainage metagenome TaxID=410659 RepID=A0A1J5SVB6_9ZZZZ